MNTEPCNITKGISKINNATTASLHFKFIIMALQRKVILYIAMSLDGYIATNEGDISFLSSVEKAGEDYGYKEFMTTVDTVIMGRKTYDKILSFGIPFPHENEYCYIITRQKIPNQKNIEFYSGSLPALVHTLKNKEGKNIFLDGGAAVVHEFLKDNLIDEIILSVIPVLLGSGIVLFQSNRPPLPLKLVHCKSFDTGLVQLHYQKG